MGDPVRISTSRGPLRLEGSPAEKYRQRTGTTITKDQLSPELAAAEAEDEARQNPPPAPREYGATNAGKQVYVRPGGNPLNPDDLVVMEPPRAAVKGGFQETHRTVSDGMPADPEYVEQSDELAIREQAANNAAFEAEKMRLAEERGVIQAQQQQFAVDESEALERKRQLDEAVAAKEQAYDGAVNEVKSSTVDPKRYEKANQGAVAFTAILGAFNLAMSKGRDKAALDMLDQNIERDIKQQETELTIKRDNAGNMLQDLQRKLGDRESAVAALRQIRLDQAANNMRLAAAGAAGDANLEAKYLGASVELDKRALENREAYRQKTIGKTTSQFTYRPGQSASAGGPRKATLKEQGEVLGLEKSRAETKSAQNKAAGIDESGKAQSLSPKQKAQVNAVDTAESGLVAMDKRDQAEGGRTVITTSPLGILGGEDVGREAKTIAPAVAEATGMKPEEVESMLTATTAGDRQANIKALLKTMRDRRKAIQQSPAGADAKDEE